MNDISPRSRVCVVGVSDDQQGQRLDNFLFRHLKGVPKTFVYRIVRKGQVRVNGGRVKPDYRLRGGDQVRIPPVARSTPRSAPAPGTVRVALARKPLYEDDHLLVLDKPAGVAVHGGSGIRCGLIEAMRQARPDLRFLELVHRLDRDTSGCLILAKRRVALVALHDDLRHNSQLNHRIDKRYLALLAGHWEGDRLRTVSEPLRRIDRGGERVVVVDARGGAFAKSVVRLRESFTGAALVEIQLFTGRTHQARVHARSMGHPVAGDEKYGHRDFNRQMKTHGLDRLFLHAHRVALVHPASGRKLRIEAQLPETLRVVLDRLRA